MPKKLKVVGVTFEKRQDKIKRLAKVPGRIKTVLKREPTNPVDPYAIRVLLAGEHIGYIQRDIARKITETWDLYIYFATLDEIIEGNDNPNFKKSWGVRINLFRIKR